MLDCSNSPEKALKSRGKILIQTRKLNTYLRGLLKAQTNYDFMNDCIHAWPRPLPLHSVTPHPFGMYWTEART